MKCLRCNGEMEHLGHESLQLGQYGFFTGHLSNLFSGALEVDIYACKSCGKLEFYRADAPSLWLLIGLPALVAVLLVLVFLMPYAALIPMPTIAAILLQVAYNMSGWRNFAHLCATASRGAVATLLLTFTLTIVFDLVPAIAVGMLITVVLFMKMVSEETEVKGWTYFCDRDSEVTHLRELPKSVRVYEINGPMFFGMTDRISDISVKDFTKYLIIRMRGVPSLDATGMNALENLYEYCAENGVQLIFSHANEQPMRTMRRAGFVDLVGEDRFRPNIDDAIAYARTQLEQEEKAA